MFFWAGFQDLVVVLDPCWAYVGPRLVHIGLSGAVLGPSWACWAMNCVCIWRFMAVSGRLKKLPTCFLFVGVFLGSYLGSCWAYAGPMLGLCWSLGGRVEAILILCWAYVGPRTACSDWAMLGVCWAYVGPYWALGPGVSDTPANFLVMSGPSWIDGFMDR